MRTIIEPFRIKMTEPIPITTRQQRERWLRQAHFNIFNLTAEQITIDLLTDSGTGAMSEKQWAAMMMGDESYAGSLSWQRFRATVAELTGFKHIFPIHQGRAGERILAQTRIKPGDVIPNNGHFDTTRANFEYAGARAVDCVIEQSLDITLDHPFKGNMDIEKLRRLIESERPENIPFAMMTITNNSFGGQPVSLENLRATRELLHEFGIPLILDAARFAENSYFISIREAGQAGRPLADIARDIFDCADGAVMSAKKDGLVNIGGFFACNDDRWAEDFRNLLILTEGFPTYGGLAGRDLEAIAVGLREALEMDYQVYRHATVEYIGKRLINMGLPVLRPVGGHAVFLEAGRFLEHIRPYPGISLVNEIYLDGGVRAVELGSVMFGTTDPATGRETPAPFELARLTFPRRVYTQSHFDYLIEVLETVWKNRRAVPGYRITRQPPFLRHFTARFALDDAAD
ncbi:MAG: tryptophanase [Nitrospinales bacterium]